MHIPGTTRIVGRGPNTVDRNPGSVRESALSDEFMVVSGLTEAAIIGATTLQKWRIKLDFEHDEVIVDPRAAKLRLLRIAPRPKS